MAVKGVIKKGEYYDSVSLMLVAREATKLNGVEDAALMIGTKENKSILESSGLLIEEFKGASESDLLIVVKAKDELLASTAIQKVEELLKTKNLGSRESEEYMPKSLEGALEILPDANMVIVSVAGRYAAREAMKALEHGLHV
ncbi:MAG: FdrA family protein, partial [Caldiserica bacterium]|nr:FdrA family protein [Caldisericota bacterium]